MKSVDVLAMVSQPGSPQGMSFRGLEWAWVALVATIVIAFVSAKRVSIVSVGWTWGAKPGQVRVRVHSFSSMSDGSIVTASGMFSAELLTDSCSESDAVSSSSDVVDSAKVAAEMVFIFEKKTPRLLKQASTVASSFPVKKIPRRRTKSLDYLRLDLSSSLTIESDIPAGPKRVGVEWDALLGVNIDAALPFWAQSLTQPLVYTAPRIVSNPSTSTSSDWDPLLRLRIRDSVLFDRGSEVAVGPLAPVAGKKEGTLLSLRNDHVVRLWNSKERLVMKSVNLPLGGDRVSAFDADWESGVAALGRTGGLVSVANLETAVFERSFHTPQPVVQALSLDRSAIAKTMFTGGPLLADPGCAVSVWDSRSSRPELSVTLPASNIFGLRCSGIQMYVRDAAGSVAAHDVRKLGGVVTRVPCDGTLVTPSSQERWWETDANEVEEQDVEDEFWDCQAADEVKSGSSSYMGSFVMAMSRNFSSKPPSK